MQKRATLKDVARKANVAISTVSGILNNRPDSWASEATRERVVKAAQELDYTPNRLARGLRLESFDTVLLMIPDLTNPFFATLARKIRHACERRGYEILIEETEFGVEREERIIRNLPKRMVDGFIGVLSNAGEVEDSLCRSALMVPSVVIGGQMKNLPVDTVESAFSDAVESILTHLCDLGHRRIGFVNSMGDRRDPIPRIDHLRRIAARLGVEFPDEWIVNCGPELSAIGETVKNRFSASERDTLPGALICLNDVAAIAAMGALREAGLRVPADVSVAGFDDIEIGAHLECPLTTVHQPVNRLAERACSLLEDRIAGRVSGPGSHEILPFEIVVRGSTAAVGPAVLS